MRSVDKEILALAGPAIVTNITTPLLGLVDTAITGHLGSAAYIGAIAVGAGMFSLAYWPMNFLRMGTSGLASQAYGASRGDARRNDECFRVLYRALVLGLALALAIVLFSPLISRGILLFMDADAATAEYAGRYFGIVVMGAPAVLCTYALAGWFLGMQDSRAPMWMSLAINVSNIALSLALVYGAGMKIEGVAVGTLASQWIGLAVGIGIGVRKYGIGLPDDWASLRDERQLGRFFSVNTDIFLRTLCLAAVTLWFTRSGSRQGGDVLAANALLMQLFMLFSYFMDGFAFAGEAMAGKYYGMGDGAKLRITVGGVFAWAFGVACIFTLIYLFFGSDIMEILTDERRVVAIAMDYLPWALAIPVAGTAAFAWDGIFIGITFTRQMLASMAIAVAVYFGCYAAFEPRMGNHGLWLAFICYLGVRGAVQTAQYYLAARRLNLFRPRR